MHCRICKGSRLKRFLDLGVVALANSYLTKEDLGKPEYKERLDVYFCEDCGLVQLGEVVSPEKLYSNYLYFSSTSPTLMKHFSDYADEVAAMHSDKSNAFVVEIASNDGIFIKNLTRHGIRFLGVDPAANIAEKANKEGLPTLNDFFNSRSAKSIEAKYGKATAIVGNNVFAHVNDVHDLIEGVNTLLAQDGFLVLEFPYLAELLDKVEFDTIYHEHLSYFSLGPLVRLFAMHDMEIFNVKRTDIHGGSIRIFVQRKGGPRPVLPAVQRQQELEKKLGLGNFETYKGFADKVERLNENLVSMLKDLKKQGRKLAAYGAPAKGNTLLCFCGIDTRLIDFTVDKSEYKQGLYTPGTHIPILAPEALYSSKPDVVLILAWNFAPEIIKQQEKFLESGGKFIIPVPSPRIIASLTDVVG